MGHRQNNVPKIDPVFLAHGADCFQIGPIIPTNRSIVHQRIIVVTDDLWMAGRNESLQIFRIIGRGQLPILRVIRKQIDIRPFPGRQLADRRSDLFQARKPARRRFIPQVITKYRRMSAHLSHQIGDIVTRLALIHRRPIVTRSAAIRNDCL